MRKKNKLRFELESKSISINDLLPEIKNYLVEISPLIEVEISDDDTALIVTSQNNDQKADILEFMSLKYKTILSNKEDSKELFSVRSSITTTDTEAKKSTYLDSNIFNRRSSMFSVRSKSKSETTGETTNVRRSTFHTSSLSPPSST